MYEIGGKVALVTGGAKGIGAAYAVALINEGAKVVIADRDETNGEQLESRLNHEAVRNVALYVHCDVTDRISLKRSFDVAIQVFGRLDIVVNNAGTVDETEQGWKKTIDLNLIAVIEGCRLAIDHYLKPGGVIVNTSSVAAVRDSTFPIYSATKAGVSTFSRSLGAPRPFEVTKVRVMAIQPGYTPTRLACSNLSELAWIKTDKPNDSLKDRLENVHPSQSTTSVAECLIHILKNGESGCIWNVIGGKWNLEPLPQRKY